MKKIYLKPNTIATHDVQTMQMIATSVPMYGVNATGAGMSRRYGWDDWDDEDEDY